MHRTEFESLDKLKSHLADSTDLARAVFQSLDLTLVANDLQGATLTDNLLLGCQTNDHVLSMFEAPIIFPKLPGLPFKTYRSTLYSPDELYSGFKTDAPETYLKTMDYLTYDHFVRTGKADCHDVLVMLARRLHDHAITDALQEFIQGKRVVAIMGGHSMRRDDPMYRQVAYLARDLARHRFLPISGGGPGAMEATHLGAWFAQRDTTELDEAITILSKEPLYDPVEPWLQSAFTVAEKFPLESANHCESLGIPTWLYGHEPPTRFATHIAKYFANSVREDGLLAIAKHGVVFAPGSAGTIQEIFQDATQNHYKSFGDVSPMVFFGESYWTSKKPIYPLLTQLARGYEYSSFLSITDSTSEVLRRLLEFADRSE